MSRRLALPLFIFVLLAQFPLASKTPGGGVIVTTPECIPDSVPGVPVLLVEKDSIPESTTYFLEDFAPDSIYLLGEVEPGVKTQLSRYGEVVSFTPAELGTLHGKDLTLPNYVVISDPQDPFYPAARLLASYRGCPVVFLPENLEDTLQKEWKFMQWEFISSLWGVWEYAMWYKTEDKLQWVGYRYLFTDALFETHDFRERMKDEPFTFLGDNTVYVAVVGDIGTSMDYWREGLSNQGILTPTLTSACDPQDYKCYRCDYSSFHKKYVAFSSVECLAPVESLNDVLFQDAPKYWVSSKKEREDIIALASSYTAAMPCPQVPLSLDLVLAEKYAVGRFTGYDLADTMAFIARALFMPTEPETYVLANNISVPVYTDTVLKLLDEAGMQGEYYPLGKAEVAVLEKFDTGIIIYNGTGNNSFFLPHFYKKGEGVATDLNVEAEDIEPLMFLFYPGNGCISFFFPDITKIYDIKISEGFSKRTWDFAAARPELFVLVSDLKGEPAFNTELDALVKGKIPPLDHFNSPFAYISATGPIGSSEFPLWFIRKGASGFCINVGMQEVLTNFEFETLFFSQVLANNSVGKAVEYAKNNVHTVGYWYPLSGLWMSEEQYVREEASCLFGDPTFTLNLETPVSMMSLDELLLNPAEEAQNRLEEIKRIKESCSELKIEIEGIDEVIAESERLINEDPERASAYVEKECAAITDKLRTMCHSELEKAEKRAGDDPEYLGILNLAKKAFDEERYTDCLVLCSQIEEKGSIWSIGIALVIVVVVILAALGVYRLRR